MLSTGRLLLLLLLFVLYGAILVRTAPLLSFPINSQVPPVARIGQPFSFVFSDTTFTSAGSSLSYALAGPPSWLSLNSDLRELSGIPQDENVGPGTVVGVNITLVATDSTGSTPDEATLVVSRNPAPLVLIPISEQIQTFGDYSEPSSILCSPEEYFKFTFAADTFADSDAVMLNYYSVLTDNSPLPAWLSFDAGSLAFAGTTPPFSSLVEPPQTFSVKLIASDVEGFSATSVNFSIVVGSHTLTTNKPNVALNATTGEPLVYAGLLGSVQLDGQMASPSQLNVTTVGLPSWLLLDHSSWNISGVPTDTAGSTTFTIIMKDAYADVLNITFSLQLQNISSLFQSTFPTLTVEPGKSFSFDLSTYLLDPFNLDVTTDVQPATSWISWDASSLTLSGEAPNSVPKSVVDVTFTVAPKTSMRSKRAGTSQSQQLVIQVGPAPESTSSSLASTSTSSPSSTTSSASTSTAAATADNAATAPHEIKWTIITIVISIVAAFAVIASLCFWCCARKKKKNKRHSQSTLSTANSSNPFPNETYIHTPGHPVDSPGLQRTISLNEKEKGKKPTMVWKPSNVRGEPILSPPQSAGFGLGAFYNNDDQPSARSTPVRKVKDWFASVRSLRAVYVLPVNRHMSTGSDLADEGRSHHGPFDLESNGPPFITLNHGSETSFRDGLEVTLPATQRSSMQSTPDAAYSADRRQRMSQRMSRRMSKRQSVQQRIVTSGVVASRPDAEADPFTDIHVDGAAVSPVSTQNNTGPFGAHPISPVTPSSPIDRPSIPIPSSSVLPNTTTTMPSLLRPARSQKSFTSAASSSIDSLHRQSRKFGRKVSAQAQGAFFTISPKRRAFAAFGKQQRNRGGRSSTKRRRGPLLEDDDSLATPALGSRSVSSPTPSAMTSGKSTMMGVSRSGMGGIAGFLSPRVWPQPARGQRHVTVPQSRAEHHAAQQQQPQQQQRHTITRRPVPSGGGLTTRSLSYSSSAASTSAMPSPLRTPVRSGSKIYNTQHSSRAMVSSPSGLGILSGTYAEIAGSSPYAAAEEEEDKDGSEEKNWEVFPSGGEESGSNSSPAAGGAWGRHRGAPATTGMVGRAIGGEEQGDRRMSVTGASKSSKESQATSGVGAYL
ncbi:unnamed protein product [Discula destructiva]